MELRAQRRAGAAAAAGDREAAAVEHERIRGELASRAEAEESGPPRLAEQRRLGARAGAGAADARPDAALARGRAGALEGELASLRERAAQAAAHRAASRASWPTPSAAATRRSSGPACSSHEAKRAGAEAERARHLVAETREQEAMHRADRRHAEESLAQMSARRHALEELERDRVGPGPRRCRTAGRPGELRWWRTRPSQRFRDHRPGKRRALRATSGRMDARRAGARPVTVRAIQEWHGEQQTGRSRAPSARFRAIGAPERGARRATARAGAGRQLGTGSACRFGGARRRGSRPPTRATAPSS